MKMQGNKKRKVISLFLLMSMILSLFLFFNVENVEADTYVHQKIYSIDLKTPYELKAGYYVPTPYGEYADDYQIVDVQKGGSDAAKDVKILEAYWLNPSGQKVTEQDQFFEDGKVYTFVLTLYNMYYRLPNQKGAIEWRISTPSGVFVLNEIDTEYRGTLEQKYIFSFEARASVLDGNLEISDIKAPVAGLSYDYNDNKNIYASFDKFSDPYDIVNDKFTINYQNAYWKAFDSNGYSKVLSNGDKFEADKDYYYNFEIKANRKYFKFSNTDITAKATFKGDPSVREYGAKANIIDEKTLGIVIPFGKPLGGSDASTPVESFTIEGLPQVLVGSTPMTDRTKISGSTSSVAGTKEKLHITSIEWFDQNGNQLSNTQKFEQGKQYKMELKVSNLGKNYLTDDSKPTVVDNSDFYFFEKISGYDIDFPLSKKVTYTVSPRLSTGQNTITDVTISGLPIALFDKTIKEAIGTPSVSSNGNVRISNLVYGNFRGHYMDDTEKFNTQDEYGLEVHLEATGNYGFANKSFNVEIDNASKNLGYELDTDLLDPIYLKDQKNAVIQLKLKPKSIVGIVDIRFPESVLPVSGEKPSFDKAKFSAEGEFNVNVNRIRWEVSNRELSNSDTFTEGSKAILGVVIDPHDSVYNVVDSALGTKFTMNGDSATAIKKDGKVIVSKDYQVKKSDKKPDPKKPQQPEQPQQPGNQQYVMHFSDVMSSDWFYNYVKYVFENGIMNGVGDGKFAPKNNVSRAMIVTMLYRIAKEPAVSGSTNFNDNTGNTWYTKAVKWTAQKGLAKEFIKGNFDPNVNLTREQMITIMYNYQKSRGKSVSTVNHLNDFKDGYLVSAYAQTPMKWAVKSGIIQGNEQKKINPQANVTRAEVAAIIQRFNELR